ncbi:MAG: GNAT family N-acetyltransferase [Pseudohongiellaceae bacterium]
MTLRFEYLADRPEDVPEVINWWYTVWADRMDGSIDSLVARLRSSLSSKSLPVNIVATLDGRMVGTAALKAHEMQDVFPGLRYWLGSVYVAPEYRGNGIATAMTSRIVELAGERNLPQLHLQTENIDGGLYARLGWEPLERVVYKGTDTLLMVKTL